MNGHHTVLKLTPLMVFGSLSISIPALAAQDFATSVQGDWQVTEVHINTQIPIQPDVITNDPNLVGRTITFTNEKISGSILVSQGCSNPKYTALSSSSFDELLKRTSEASADNADKIDAKNYGFAIPGATIVNPNSVSCAAGMLGPKGKSISNWIINTGGKTIITNWDSDSYLTLQKLSGNPVPAPSFPCGKAGTPAEKTICASYNLASWDRSVNNAYKIASSQIRNIGNDVDGKLKKLSAEQHSWLQERNSFGTDTACLESKMSERTESLVESAK